MTKIKVSGMGSQVGTFKTRVKGPIIHRSSSSPTVRFRRGPRGTDVSNLWIDDVGNMWDSKDPPSPSKKMFRNELKPAVEICKKCGYIWNWRDYTKFNSRSEREKKVLQDTCIKCGFRRWRSLDIDNQLDAVLIMMEEGK